MDFYDQISLDSKKFYIELLESYENSGQVFPFHLAKPESFDKTVAINITVSEIQGEGFGTIVYAAVPVIIPQIGKCFVFFFPLIHYSLYRSIIVL